MSAFCVVGEMDDFESVVVGIVEIGAAAGEDALVALILAEHVDALGLELGDGRLKGIAVDHEGMVDDVGEPLAAGFAPEHDVVAARFQEHEMRILLRHLRDELEPEDIGVEGPAAGGIADRNGEVQDAFGFDHLGTFAGASGSRELPATLEKISPAIKQPARRVTMPAAAVDNSRLKPSLGGEGAGSQQRPN